MIIIETKHWRRVSKPRARKLFNSGENVYCLPWKVNPENVWMSPCLIEGDFDKFINEYMYNNCADDTGKYLYYYIRIA